ncbi:ABC transporter permease subunit [Mesorhizobium retamae]|uniref:ABC transporter permease subunit n=1 Tax=Mesorhizobium retamae TaxID=2912854 RepID=A0ABS9QD61_9HYPH|nr:ABC transporter permease subunit [Mesorhizobium sp. IRAMC:0171]MCG7505359.1 ABC transporter permease subunit [Mesorhizobium sp. IRAMC:0171]
MTETIIDIAVQLAPAFGTTLWLSLVSLVFAIVLSLCLATGLAARWRAVAWMIDVCINVPMVIKLFVCFYLIRIDANWCAVIAIVLHQSAFAASILYGGLKEVPHELEDAALTTGLSRTHTFFLIRLPVALRLVSPALVLQAVEIIKNSSTVSLIGVFDLTASVEAFQNRTFAYTHGFVAAAVAYAILTLPLMSLGWFWERGKLRGSPR